MTRLVQILAALAAMAFAFAAPARAHEVRPAYLAIQQTGPHAYQVVWKQPTVGEMAIHLVPHMSNGWLEKAPNDQFAADGYLMKSWTIADDARPLPGVTVSIEGLDATVTDVLVRLRLAGKTAEQDVIVRPEHAQMTIPGGKTSVTTTGFFRLGVEHILRGPDHLLFVLGLLLIVTDRRKLIRTITAFTVAHSLTLAVATLTGVTPPTALLNALIALSILFTGAEVARAHAGGTSLTIRHPWVVAFAFGLLHGFGFASGLTGLGLTQGTLAAALVLFNLGVEAGQLAFIALVLALRRAFRLMEIQWSRWAEAAPTYAIGGLGAFWTLQYLAVLFAPTS